MDLTFLGTGSAIPTGRAQTGLLLEDAPLLIDCGSGTFRTLQDTAVAFDAIETILITHPHIDHLSDLMPLLKADSLVDHGGVTIYGPDGIETTIDGLFDTFDYMQGAIDVRVETFAPGATIDVCGHEVRTLATQHGAPSTAYRIDDVIAFSGDTAPLSAMGSFVDGCPVVVHECSFTDDRRPDDHTYPSGLVDALSGADIDALYLTHLFPEAVGHEATMLETIRAGLDATVELASDGQTVTIDTTT